MTEMTEMQIYSELLRIFNEIKQREELAVSYKKAA